MAAVAAGLLTRSSTPPPMGGDADIAAPPEVPAAEARTWKAAARRAAEPRGERTGMGAAVHVPSELRHYAERRRFLAVQVAETEEQDIDLPHDEAELIEFIRAGQLVKMPVLGDDYLLYGVGASASGEPFAHWDERSGAQVPLLTGWAEYKDQDEELAAREEEAKAEAARLRAELKRTRVRARTRRRQLQSQIRAADSRAAALQTQRKRLASWYDDYDRRRRLVSEYALIHEFARDFDGNEYDLEQPAQRRLMRARLLQYVRPEAREVILEVAREYNQAFGRPLPVTSLVRTEAYQLQLGRRNPNATTIDSPPHATGLAFDVHYGHMTAAEQEAVMSVLARMEQDGRVEGLRETRNHFHVFVFPDGQRPSERLIADSLDDVRPAARVARTSGGTRSKLASSRVRRAASVRRAPTRTTAEKKAPARKAPATTRTRRSTRRTARR
ncbi:MAG TPA: DUF5715 family protein [Vicinamibacteria bacterium]|nr:DUF5715 family protein [Vicinamibacteria bacterium]